MFIVIYYPYESVPIIWHLTVFVIITLMVSIALCIAYSFWVRIGTILRWRKNKDKAVNYGSDAITEPEKNVAGDSDRGDRLQAILTDIIPIGSIIIALVSPIIPFFFIPSIDYNAIQDSLNDKLIHIKVTNYGLVSAKNLDVSVYSPNSSFAKLETMPLMFNSTLSLNSIDLNNNNSGLLRFKVLPPKSQTIVNAFMKENHNSNNEVQVFIRSEETIGYHNLGYFTLAYLVYSIILAINIIWLYKSDWKPSILKFILVNLGAALIILTFFVGACDWYSLCSNVKPA